MATLVVQLPLRPRAHAVCLILCDGQPNNQADTEKAIVEASSWPVAIVLIGIGDGPWEAMRTFDDELPQRKFDNVNLCVDTALLRSCNLQAVKHAALRPTC